MQYSMALTAALVAGASAHYNGSISYTTEIVDQYTTYCPGATQITHAEKTYTVTEATLLTITNCPCTLTKPVSSFIPVTSVPVVSSSAAPVVVVSSSAAPIVVSSAAPVVTSSAAAVVVVSSSAAPVVTSVATVAAPVVASTAVVAPIFANSTAAVVAPVGTAASSVSPATPSVSAFKGAANHVAASGFGLAGVLAIAAYLL